MGAGKGKQRRVSGGFYPGPRGHERIFAVTGPCPVMERTGDGKAAGRCWEKTIDGICPRPGNVSAYLGDDAPPVDENDLPPREHRDFGDEQVQALLGISSDRP